MLAERCYPETMTDEPRVSEMTEFGKALWLVVQEQAPHSRASLARFLGKQTGWQPSRQAISQWLKGERDAPRELVPAVVEAFDLSEETAQRLEFLYFYGQGGESYNRWRQGRGPIPGSGDLITEENRQKIDEVQSEWERRDEEKRRERDSRGSSSKSDAGDRTS